MAERKPVTRERLESLEQRTRTTTFEMVPGDKASPAPPNARDVLDALAPQVASKGNRIYVAGPISKGDRETNYAAAIDAADRLLVAGWNPYVPHLCHWWHERHSHTHAEWMAHDFVWVAACDALVRLPGESAGADQEVALACRLGIPVYDGIEAVPAPVPDEIEGFLTDKGARERARRSREEEAGQRGV